MVERRRVDLTVRAGSGDTVLVRASNDRLVDHYGTVITAEALMRDWWAGYRQHRTVSLQHNLPELRGIEGQPNIGRAVRVDFTPQLEVEVQVLDPRVMALVTSGKINSASLEFVPIETEHRAYAGADLAEVYHRLSPEPEHTGLSLVDVPGVPGADVLALRALPALWAYAVVDPLVLNGEITDPDQVAQLAWLPHHDTRSHSVDETQLRRALEDLEQGRVTIPPFASLTAAQVADRARAHLERHTVLGLGRSQRARPHKEGKQMNEWIRARTAQLVAEGTAQADAEKQAKTAYNALAAEVRARIEGEPADADADTETESRGLFARLFGRGDVTVNVNEAPAPQPVQARAATEQPTEPAPVAEHQVDDAALDARIQARLAEISKQPENPMAAIASGIRIRSGRMEPEQVLSEVLTRTVLKQATRQEVTAQDRQEVANILREHGISERALTIEDNGTVIMEELARQFAVKPAPDVIFRNHMRSLPMSGAKKVDFPRFDRSGLSFQWNRQNTPSTGSLTDITPSDPTLDTFPIEVTELNGATKVADSFLTFNASGARFVSEYLLPEFRGAAQAAEDRAFWLSTKGGSDPATFYGLRNQTGVTDANPGATAGTAFSENVLNAMLRAMPAAFRSNPGRLAYYLPLERADDFAEIRAARATALGDAYAQDRATIPGPAPVGRYRGIDVFAVNVLPTDETVGSDSGICGTGYLVHRDFVAIGDGLTIRIEPIRLPNFVTAIQLQEFVGLGYEWPTSVVRYAGMKAKAA